MIIFDDHLDNNLGDHLGDHLDDHLVDHLDDNLDDHLGDHLDDRQDEISFRFIIPQTKAFFVFCKIEEEKLLAQTLLDFFNQNFHFI